MQGKQFLDLAREVLTGGKERHFRGAVGRAYYALMLESRDALARWQFAIPPRDGVHSFVRLRFTFAADKDLKAFGRLLEWLCNWRNRSDYDLVFQANFATPKLAQKAIQECAAHLAILDAIDADPARRAAAVAAIRQAFP